MARRAADSGSAANFLRIVDPSPGKRAIRSIIIRNRNGAIPVEGPINSSPVIADGAILFGSDSGSLYAFE